MKPFITRQEPTTMKWFAAIVGMLILCCGCAKSDGVQRAAVAGKVTLDGVDIQQGTIVFFPTGANKGPSAGGTIENGRYSIAASRGPVVGANRVEIRASKKTGRKVQAPMAQPGKMVDEFVEAIPDRYNSSSTLVTELKSGSNTFDCILKSK